MQEHIVPSPTSVQRDGPCHPLPSTPSSQGKGSSSTGGFGGRSRAQASHPFPFLFRFVHRKRGGRGPQASGGRRFKVDGGCPARPLPTAHLMGARLAPRALGLTPFPQRLRLSALILTLDEGTEHHLLHPGLLAPNDLADPFHYFFVF